MEEINVVTKVDVRSPLPEQISQITFNITLKLIPINITFQSVTWR